MPITTTPSGGPQGEYSTYTPIYSTTLSANTSSVTISNIPQTYTDLVLVATARRNIDNAGGAGTMIFNGVSSGSLYSTTILYNSGNTLYSGRWSSVDGLYGGFATADGALAHSITHILNYSNSTTFKSYLGDRGQAGNDPRREFSIGTYRSTSPITSITLSAANDIKSGATITLYGVKAA